jgi:hypothetical protein
MLGPPRKTSPAKSIQPLCTQKSVHINLTLLKSRAHKRPTSDPTAHGRSLMPGFSPPHPCALPFFFTRTTEGNGATFETWSRQKTKKKKHWCCRGQKKESPAKVPPRSPRLAHRPRSLRPGSLRTTHSPVAQPARPPLRHRRTASVSSLRRPSQPQLTPPAPPCIASRRAADGFWCGGAADGFCSAGPRSSGVPG